METLLTVLTILAVGLGIWLCLMIVPPYTSVLVTNVFGGSVRPCGSGLQKILPWEEVVAGSEVSMEISNYSFTSDFETKDEVPVSLKTAFDLLPDERYLVEYRRFNAATRITGITERIRAILTQEIRKLKDRDEVMDDFQKLTAEVKRRFEETVSDEDGKPLEQYYGIDLKKLMISDGDLPAALKEATARKEVMAKDNETRQMEMTKFKQMAAAVIAESVKRGSPMSFEKAMEFIQLQFGKGNVQKNITLFGLDSGTQEAVKEVLREVLNARR